ncbi:MAG: DivIVA domain-containing protein, partial [Lachnospiraceae bacterium]|nr:DivIVA domain-containing protein [Lachnospiraceae bacterium]
MFRPICRLMNVRGRYILKEEKYMLTPVEIQAKTFKSGGLGYDKKDVESFMREVTRSYEIL